ncbi:flagellar hook-basal body complex protein FliE [Wukongibacter baidiensis]|uniref:flagellar hook-basal body complex protein FliE n=1 Tax=Wukongibacter baidiensis TaxID=1723361 RepID=UPI003D7FF74B
MKISNIYNSELLKTNINDKKIANTNDFKDFLMGAIDKLNAYENESNRMGQMLAIGEVDNIQDVMIASQKADIALNFAIEVKNKVMDAYKEIMRMQV